MDIIVHIQKQRYSIAIGDGAVAIMDFTAVMDIIAEMFSLSLNTILDI